MWSKLITSWKLLNTRICDPMKNYQPVGWQLKKKKQFCSIYGRQFAAASVYHSYKRTTVSNIQVRHVTLVFLWLRDNSYLRKYTFQAFFFTEYACLSIIMDNHKWNVSHEPQWPTRGRLALNWRLLILTWQDASPSLGNSWVFLDNNLISTYPIFRK